MGVDQVVQVGSHHGAGIDHGVAINLGLLPQVVVDPDGGQAKGWVGGGGAGQRGADLAGVDGHPLTRHGFTLTDLHALEPDHVGLRLDLQVVPDVHHRHQKADVLGKFFADAFDPAQQFTVLGAVHQRDQPVADLQTQRVNQRHVVPGGFLLFGEVRYRSRGWGHDPEREGGLLGNPPTEPDETTGNKQKGKVGHARDQAHEANHAGRQE